MVLFVGSFQFLPLVLVLMLVVLASALASLAGLAVWALSDGVLPIAILGTVPAVVVVVLAEITARRLQARRHPRYVARLQDLARGRRFTEPEVGGKALGLARLLRLGLPVPEGVVLCSPAVARLLALPGGPGAAADPFRVLPFSARRRLGRFLRDASPGRVIVRSSFEGEDAEHRHAGVFRSVRDVDPGDPRAVARAIGEVLASADGEVAQDYRAATGSRPGRTAILIQRQAPSDRLGIAASRPSDGRSDQVLLETGRPGEPWQTWAVDLAAQALVPLLPAPGDALPVPAWAWRVATAVVGLEAESGGPVQVEFGRAGEEPVFLQVRSMPRAHGSTRRVRVTGGFVDLPSRAVAPLRQALRGGDEGLLGALRASMDATGLRIPVAPEEAGYADGVAFVDAEVIRRAVAGASRTAGLPGMLRQAAALLAPVGGGGRERLHPPAPVAGEAATEAWEALEAWARTRFVAAARCQAGLTGRLLVVRRLLDTLAAAGDDRPVLDAVRAARAVLRRRQGRLSKERDAWRAALEGAEEEGLDRVAVLLGLPPGPSSRDLVQWARPEEIPGILRAGAIPADRPGPSTQAQASGLRSNLSPEPESPRAHQRDAWSARARDGDGSPVPFRFLDPPDADPVPPTGSSGPGAVFPGLVVHPGCVRGVLTPVDLPGDGFADRPGPAVAASPEARPVLVLPDGDPRYYAHLAGAAGVVLLRGGVLCHLAVGIAERGLPALRVTDDRVARLAPGTPVLLDADHGILRVEEGP